MKFAPAHSESTLLKLAINMRGGVNSRATLLRHPRVKVGIRLSCKKLRAPLVRLPWVVVPNFRVVVPIFRVVSPIWVVYPTSRNEEFWAGCPGSQCPTLGCNALFHGAPGTFGEVTQGRRTHSICCCMIILCCCLMFLQFALQFLSRLICRSPLTI